MSERARHATDARPPPYLDQAQLGRVHEELEVDKEEGNVPHFLVNSAFAHFVPQNAVANLKQQARILAQ